MGIIGFILRRKSVYRLRKNYDRIREKADREPDMNRKIAALRSLDQLEPTIVALEEQLLSGFERRRMIKYVDHNLQRAKRLLKGEEYASEMPQQRR